MADRIWTMEIDGGEERTMTNTSSRRASVDDRWFTRGGARTTRHGVGMRWRARYSDDRGVENTKSFARKVDAQVWIDGIITRLTSGTYTAPADGRVTVGSVYTSWTASQSHIAVTTAATRRSTWISWVESRWADANVVDVKTSAVRSWVSEMVAADAGAATVENAYGLLRQVLGAAVEDRAIPRNPCDGVKLPKRLHSDRGYLTHARVVAIAAAVDRNPEVPSFLAYTGLRWGEMAALRVQDFDMLRRRVNVSRSVTEVSGLVWSTPKTHERRSVAFPSALADELAGLMVGRGRDDLVFTDSRGGVLRVSNWRARVFAPAVLACQLADDAFPTVTPHDLRHTAASLAISAGANVKAVQRMLGHAKASMTLDVYADLFDEDLDAVADRMDEAIRAVR